MFRPSPLLRLALIALLLALLALTAGPLVAATTIPSYYIVTDLGVLPGTTEPRATAINDSGQVVGVATRAGNAQVGFLYDQGQIQDLGGYDDADALANALAINNQGQIVGGATLISNGVKSSLGAGIVARALNDSGQVVGSRGRLSKQTPTEPVSWQAGVTTTIPTVNGGGVAYGTNNAGQIVGRSSFSVRDEAFLYTPGDAQATDLNALGGFTASEAFAVNAAGHVVGCGFSPADATRSQPTLWRDGQAIDLGGEGQALAINDTGQIVGWLGSFATGGPATWRAALWRDGTIFDLNTLIPADSGWVLSQATDINNAGQIVGHGRHDGQPRAFALTPRFRDLAPADPYRDAILALADRGIIRGYGDGRVGPADPVLRAQSAALIARAVGWDAEDWPGTTFPDQSYVDDDLWRNVRTLAHHQVALGYEDGTYNPTGEVLEQQVVLFIARALVATGAWTERADTSPYPNLANATAREQADRRSIATYVHYAGAVPGRPVGQAWAGWDQPATRGWFAQALWQALQTLPGAGPAP